MKFYGRENEMKLLRDEREMSKNSGRFTVITGRRRIGKTMLIKESMSDGNGRFLYFFVRRSAEPMLCAQLAECAKTQMGITLFDTGRFSDLFEQLMIYGQDHNFTFVIDEFQELARSNGSIASGIQMHWDGYGRSSKVNLIVCGSVHSMMIRIFRNDKEPLFGRATSKFDLRRFGPGVIKMILKDHNPEYTNDDLLFLYTVTGGVPKYLELLMDSGAVTFETMLDRICRRDSLFLTDGHDILISEFGKDYGTYFSILELISGGKNTSREISDILGKECSSYLDNLDKEYSLVKKSRPIFSEDDGRIVRWIVSDKYLRFYFKFIGSNRSVIELEQYDLLKDIIRRSYDGYSGRILEDYFREKIAEEERVTEIGSYWDRKGHNEIDMIALNNIEKKASVFEIKRDPKRADAGRLKEKAGTIRGLDGFDIEYGILSLEDM